jgi:hypothetical protein
VKRGDIIKHDKFMDVACQILQITKLDHKYVLKVHWINQGFVDTMLMNYTSRITIKKEHLTNWYICNQPLKKCIRYSEWRKAV